MEMPWGGVIRKYRRFLPVTEKTPIITLNEGDTPLLPAPALAAVLPVEAQITACDPSSSALEMAMVMPRSLNEPVGLSPSYLR